jgi:hypothetical protein
MEITMEIDMELELDLLEINGGALSILAVTCMPCMWQHAGTVKENVTSPRVWLC